ncbi:MAG: flagellar biosynthesis anti-sigma factor FlgM [Pseudomonadales bacterium]
MVREINGLGRTTPTPTTTERSAKKPADSPAPTASSAGQSTADDVQLSSEAKTLQSLVDKVKDLPVVNVERAEKIKAALENGEYTVDDLVLADKILSSEAFLDQLGN